MWRPAIAPGCALLETVWAPPTRQKAVDNARAVPCAALSLHCPACGGSNCCPPPRLLSVVIVFLVNRRLTATLFSSVAQGALTPRTCHSAPREFPRRRQSGATESRPTRWSLWGRAWCGARLGRYSDGDVIDDREVPDFAELQANAERAELEARTKGVADHAGATNGGGRDDRCAGLMWQKTRKPRLGGLGGKRGAWRELYYVLRSNWHLECYSWDAKEKAPVLDAPKADPISLRGYRLDIVVDSKYPHHFQLSPAPAASLHQGLTLNLRCNSARDAAMWAKALERAAAPPGSGW